MVELVPLWWRDVSRSSTLSEKVQRVPDVDGPWLAHAALATEAASRSLSRLLKIESFFEHLFFRYVVVHPKLNACATVGVVVCGSAQLDVGIEHCEKSGTSNRAMRLDDAHVLLRSCVYAGFSHACNFVVSASHTNGSPHARCRLTV